MLYFLSSHWLAIWRIFRRSPLSEENYPNRNPAWKQALLIIDFQGNTRKGSSTSLSDTGYGTISETPIMSGLADERNEPAHSYNPNYEIHNTSSPENGGIVIYGNFMIHDGPDDLSEFGWGAAGCMEICGKSGFENLKSTIHSLSGSSKPIEQGLVELAGAGKLMIHIEQAIRPTPKPI